MLCISINILNQFDICFEREYNLKYSTGVGNVFLENSLQKAEQLGKELWVKYGDNIHGQACLGIDPGFGSSKTGFCLIEFVDGFVRVVHTKQFERSTVNEVVNHAFNLIDEYDLYNGTNFVFVDSANPEIIKSIKISIGEFTDYEVFVKKAKEDGNRPLSVVPVSFAGTADKLSGGRAMLGKVKKWVDKGKVAIEPNVHSELMTQIRLASSNELMELDKSEMSLDLLDSLRLAFNYVKD